MAESSTAADACLSCQCGSHACQDDDSNKDSAPTPHEHNSDNCAVCQTLALAQDNAVALVGIVGSEALPEWKDTVYVAIDPIRINAIQSRGPPA